MYLSLSVSLLSLVATAIGGIVFGLALAAPPGPMNAVIAEESALRGWRAGFKAGLGAMSADICFFVLALVGLTAVVRREPLLERALLGVGGLLMLWFAYGAVREATAFSEVQAALDEEGRGFRKAFVLALTNPYQIAFWLTVGVGLLEPGEVDALARLPFVGAQLAGRFVVRTGHPVLLGGLFVGVACWIVGFPAAIVAARRRAERAGPAIAWASALVLAATGTLFLFRAL